MVVLSAKRTSALEPNLDVKQDELNGGFVFQKLLRTSEVLARAFGA